MTSTINRIACVYSCRQQEADASIRFEAKCMTPRKLLQSLRSPATQRIRQSTCRTHILLVVFCTSCSGFHSKLFVLLWTLHLTLPSAFPLPFGTSEPLCRFLILPFCLEHVAADSEPQHGRNGLRVGEQAQKSHEMMKIPKRSDECSERRSQERGQERMSAVSLGTSWFSIINMQTRIQQRRQPLGWTGCDCFELRVACHRFLPPVE